MKKEKMSLDKMRKVLNNVLSREEMKEVMAGSGGGGGGICGSCWDESVGQGAYCYGTSGANCWCGGSPCHP
jgi:hypothetical protein